jgi:hypothetical protein
MGYLLACVAPSSRPAAIRGSVTLRSVPGVTNGNVTGSAHLSQSNGSLTVRAQASVMHPGSPYATLLNLSSCQWLGYVLYGLPQMNADANGNGSISITIYNAEPLSASND